MRLEKILFFKTCGTHALELMVVRSNEYVRFPAGGRMLRCAADGAYTFAANLPVESWQCARHSTAEKALCRVSAGNGNAKKVLHSNQV